jgi:hypothetical protein
VYQRRFIGKQAIIESKMKHMDTFLIQLTNSRAYRLLQELEELQLIKVLKRNTKEDAVSSAPKSNTAKFRGALKLSDEQYEDFQQHAKDIRNEWQDSI